MGSISQVLNGIITCMIFQNNFSIDANLELKLFKAQVFISMEMPVL